MMNNPYKKKKKSLRTKILFLIVIGIVFVTFSYYKQSTKTNEKVRKDYIAGTTTGTISSNSDNSTPLDLNTLQQKCSNLPPPTTYILNPDENWSKPIWFAALFHSFPDKTHKELINQLTNLKQGGKSFYASVKDKLRHCLGITETATCFTGDLPKVQNRDKFYDKYIMVIRNPKTTFPSADNMKNMKYHDLIGQVPIDEWRNVRDTYIEKMMDEWVDKITEWKKTDYDVGLYLVYEDLLDSVKGPGVVKQIGNLLHESGFEIVNEEQIPCVWYSAVGEAEIKQYQKNKYDYNDYVPGYTKEQQQLMMNRLESLMGDIARDGDGDSGGGDVELLRILKEYHDDIRDNIIIDEKFVSSE
jgi:hypothetical protein